MTSHLALGDCYLQRSESSQRGLSHAQRYTSLENSAACLGSQRWLRLCPSIASESEGAAAGRFAGASSMNSPPHHCRGSCCNSPSRDSDFPERGRRRCGCMGLPSGRRGKQRRHRILSQNAPGVLCGLFDIPRDQGERSLVSLSWHHPLCAESNMLVWLSHHLAKTPLVHQRCTESA